jgi:ribosomal protein S18 acetylase RimI-like enzyme
MKEKITVRDFSEKDMKKILEYRQETACISFPGINMNREQSRKSVLFQLKKYPGTIKVAEIKGKPIGYIRFHARKGSLERYGRINIIFVEKNYRNRGIGKLLLEKAEEWFRLQGIGRMEAVVTNSNVSSCEFFRHKGYAEKRTVFEKLCD